MTNTQEGSTMTDDKRSKKLDQVRKILELALGERKLGNDEAADNYEARADQMMVEYAIDEMEIEWAKEAKVRTKPEVRSWKLMIDDDDWDINQAFVSIFHSMCTSLGIKVVGGTWRDYKVIGWPADLDHLDLLYTQIMFHMIKHLNPQADTELDEQRNVVMLKEAGLKWKDVYLRMRKAGFYPDGPELMDKTHGVRFTKLYTSYCHENDHPRNYASPTVYRRSFIEGYSGRISSRLYEIRRAREEATEGKGLAVVGMADLLQEALYEMFPEKRPHEAGCRCATCTARRKPVRYTRHVDRKIDHSARQAGSRAADTADLGSGNRVQNKRGELS